MRSIGRVCLLSIVLVLPFAGCVDATQELNTAARDGDLGVAEKMLAKGADVNFQNGEGKTALLLAAEGGHTEVVRAILEAGADVDTKDGNGCTSLTLAAAKGHADSVELLLGKGAQVDPQLCCRVRLHCNCRESSQ
jgi:ankyrin repeat protein